MSLSNNFPVNSSNLNLSLANAGRLDPRVTFTRASTGTYYDGYSSAKAEENLVTYSQQFDNAIWGKDQGTLTADTTAAPDGTTTADTFVENTATDIHRLNNGGTLTPAGVSTGSVFVKAGAGTRYPTIGFQSGNSAYASATFDLSTGTSTQTLSASYTSVSATITSAGGGWYRCSITCTTTAASAFYFALSSASTFVNGYRGAQSYTGDNTSSLIFWGAQVEQRSSVTSYTATTTAPITNYIPVLQTAAVDVPRFDHNPTTRAALGLLVEEQRANSWVQSADFSNASWTKVRSSISADAAVSPAGTVTADKFIASADASTTHFVRQDVAVTSGTTYTQTIFAKAAEYNQICLGFDADSSQFADAKAVFTLTGSGSISVIAGTFASSSITAVGNGWYRCQVSAAATATVTAIFRIYAANGGTNSFTGDGYSGVFIWGAQLEAGAFPTSYIATTTASVTRNADVASMTGTNFSAWYNATEGTIYFEGGIPSNYSTGFPTFYSFNDGTTNNNIQPAINASADVINVEMKVSGSVVAGFYPAYVSGTTKLVFAYKLNDVNYAKDGVAGTTDTSAAVPSMSQLNICANQAPSNYLNGTIRNLRYYPVRNSNAQLQALTG